MSGNPNADAHALLVQRFEGAPVDQGLCPLDAVLAWRTRKSSENKQESEVHDGHSSSCVGRRTKAPGLVRAAGSRRTEAIETRFTALAAGGRQTTIVDLREVTFLASLGIRMLVSSARTLVKSGAKLVLLGPQPAVRLALEGTGLTALLPIAADDGEALLLATA